LDPPALKAIYRRFLFTQLGPTGYAMHSDFFVEEANKRTCNHAGKIVFRGLDAVLEQAVYQDTVVQEHDGNIIESLRTGSHADKINRSKTHINTPSSGPLMKMYEYLYRECQFFHATEPPILGRSKEDGSPIYAEV
jgi:hypothetical protein